MLAQAGQMSVQLVDTIMIGHVSTTELAAAAFSNSLFVIGMVFGIGFAFGATPLVGEALGEGDKSKIGDLFGNAFHLNIFVTVFLFLIMYALSFAMPYMGQPENVVKYAIPYYRILVFSLFPLLFFYTVKQFLEGLGNTHKATICILLANVLNIVLNYILIFGKFGFDAMGLEGAGIATLISRLFMALTIILMFVKSNYYLKYKTYIRLGVVKLEALMRLFKFSLPIAFQLVIEVVAFSLGGLMMGWFGEIALAAHQITLGLASFTYMIASGIGSAVTIRVSFQKGAGHFVELKKAGIASFHLVIAFMLLTALSFLIFRDYLPLLFTNDIAVIKITSVLLVYAAVFQIVDGIQVVGVSALRGLSDVKFALWMSLLSYGILALGASYLFAFVFKFGYEGIWIGYVLGLLFASIVFFKRFIKLSDSLL